MLETLLNEGWNYHDSESERLARELEEAAAAGVDASFLRPFLDLATHAIGEHLGDWPRVLALGQRVLGDRMPSAETAAAWERLYVAAVLAGDVAGATEIELACLQASNDAVASVLQMRLLLANALVGAQRAGEGARIYRSALAYVQQPGGSPYLDLSLAVASNNLAWTLYEMPSRTNDDTALMQLAADTSLTFWRRCGTWINEERALHLKSVVALATGDAQSALTFADEALAIIAANGERPIDTERLQEVRERAQRA